MKSFISLLVLLFVFSHISFSQRVIPSDRVTSYVNVREMPTSGSDVVCTISPGEFAEYIESIPYWHKVRCTSGETGYVSKSWTSIDDGTSKPEGKDELFIASWNIKWFGQCVAIDPSDYSAMAEIVCKYDVMAIQELMSNCHKDRLDSLVAALNKRGYKYDYLFTPVTGYSRNNPDSLKGGYYERFGYIWDIDRVEIINPDDPYNFITEPVKNNPDFRQVPVEAEFKVKSANGFDFKVVNVHTVFKKELSHVRGGEFRYLDRWMKQQVTDPGVVEKDIFIMGDFNANPPKQDNYFDTIIQYNDQYRVIFKEPLLKGQPSIRTKTLIPSSTDPDTLSLPVYDHILLSKHTSYALPSDTLDWDSMVIGVDDFDQDARWQAYGSTDEVDWIMSDHRPIWIKIPYDTEDRD